MKRVILAEYDDYFDRLKSDPDLVAELAHSKHWTDRQEAAKSPAASPEILEMLSNDDNYSVRATVAKNPSASPDLLRKIAHKETDGWVLQWMLQNPNSPQDAKQYISEHRSSDLEPIFFSMSNNSAKDFWESYDIDDMTPEQILDILWEDESFSNIDRQVQSELGIYIDYSSIRGDYGYVYIFSDPTQSNSNVDTWLGDPDAALAEVDYSDFAYDVASRLVGQPESKWKLLYKKSIQSILNS